jgi:ankyrin repeat protein
VLCAALLAGLAYRQAVARSIDARDVFSDGLAAQLADAAATGDTTRMHTLIKKGADVNAIGDKGTSVLQWTMLHQSKAGVELLLAAGADAAHVDEAGDTVMHYAAKANDSEYLDILLAHRVEVDIPNAQSGATPMMAALMGNRDVQFRKLLLAGANPNAADRFGNTALHVAAKIGQSERVLDLLKAHADPNARNRQGATFQRYLDMTPASLLTPEARQHREAIKSWLREHDGDTKQ